MNVQQHERIARIKQLSHYLYLCLTGIYYLLQVLCPLAVIFALVSVGGKFTFMGVVSINNTELFFLQRLIIAIVMSIIFFLILKLTHHFRELIRHFANGDIFNKKAIEHARKALMNGLVIYGVYLSGMFAGWVYTFIKYPSILISINGGFIVGFIFFGLMYVLLWALEIGCDINEESELTI